MIIKDGAYVFALSIAGFIIVLYAHYFSQIGVVKQLVHAVCVANNQIILFVLSHVGQFLTAFVVRGLLSRIS